MASSFFSQLRDLSARICCLRSWYSDSSCSGVRCFIRPPFVLHQSLRLLLVLGRQLAMEHAHPLVKAPPLLPVLLACLLVEALDALLPELVLQAFTLTVPALGVHAGDKGVDLRL